MMRLNSRDVKDKRITKAGLAFVAEVHLWSGVIDAGRHLTLKSAQRALAKYPPDVFEGNDDPAKAKKSEKKRLPGLDLRPYQRPHKQNNEYTRLYDRRLN